MRRRLGVAAVLLDDEPVPGDCAVDDDGRLDAVGLPPAAGGRRAAPGLVDLQVNGFDGVDVMGADTADLLALGRSLLRYGVTSYLPTPITAAPADTDAALDVLAELAAAPPAADGANVLGAHLEGPFLSPARLGTHPPAHRRDPDLDRGAGSGAVTPGRGGADDPGRPPGTAGMGPSEAAAPSAAH